MRWNRRKPPLDDWAGVVVYDHGRFARSAGWSVMADYTVQSKPTGGHWTAWVTASGSDKPAGHVILVGQTQQEAETHARQWQDRIEADPTLLRS
jgi:hypothetical protein